MNEQAQDIRRKLEGANVVPLAMALAQLSGDLSVLREIAVHVRGAWEHLESVPDDVAARIRDRLVTELLRVRAGGHAALPQPDKATVKKMMSVAVGEDVSEEYMPMLLEHMGLSEAPRPKVAAASKTRIRAAIIGAGASGLCAAVELGARGIDYTVFEKNEDVGGTWLENTYPGCAVDTPNHFYQFSFEPNNDWPHYFSQQESIRGYLSRFADKYGVRQRVRFGTEVQAAQWQEASGTWKVDFRDRDGRTHSLEVEVLISAVGQLNRPKIPDIPGLENFKGQVLHTAAWPKDADLRGKRVALLGTGASAIQVGPAIAGDVKHLHVFQRSGSWIARRPNIDRAVTDDKKWVLNNVPFYAAWYRFQLFWAFGDGLFEALKIDPQWQHGSESINATNAKVREAMLRYFSKELEGRPDLLAKVVPSYPPFGKRVLGDTGWFKMLRSDHVSLHVEGIQSVQADGIVTQDGEKVEVDAIVMATGFHAGRMLWPMDIRGRSGANIRDVWGEDNPRAYLGITVPDYPNLFILYGPNTNVGHGGSAIFLAECQVNYAMKLIEALQARGESIIEVRRDVHDKYNEVIDGKLRQLSWSHPSVNTWYKNDAGRIVTNQPWRLVEYWGLTREPHLEEYRFGQQQPQ